MSKLISIAVALIILQAGEAGGARAHQGLASLEVGQAVSASVEELEPNS